MIAIVGILPVISQFKDLVPSDRFSHVKEPARLGYQTESFLRHHINLMPGLCATGKSFAVGNLIDSLPKSASVLVIAPLTNLNRELAFKYDLEMYDDIKANSHTFHALNDANRLAITYESLVYLNPRHFDVVFLDEGESGLGHAVNSPTMIVNNISRSKTVLSIAKALVANAGVSIIADANMGCSVLEFVSQITKESARTKINIIENRYIPKAIAGARLHVISSIAELHGMMQKHIDSKSDAEVIGFCSNLKKRVKEVETIFTKKCKVKIVTRDDPLPYRVSALTYFSDSDLCGYSPSLNAGIDLPLKSLTTLYAIIDCSNEHWLAELSYQMLHRPRHVVDIYIVMLGGSDRDDLLPVTTDEVIKGSIEARNEHTYSVHQLEPVYDIQSMRMDFDCMSRMRCAYQAQLNMTRNGARSHLVKLMRHAGYKIIFHTKDSEMINDGQNLKSTLPPVETDHVDVDIPAASRFTAAIRSNIEIAKLDAVTARQLDRLEWRDQKAGNLDTIDATHYAVKNRILVSILQLAGVDINAGTLDADVSWGNADKTFMREIRKVMKRKNDHLFFNDLKFKAAVAKGDETRWFNHALRKIGLLMKVRCTNKCKVYTIDKDSLLEVFNQSASFTDRLKKSA